MKLNKFVTINFILLLLCTSAFSATYIDRKNGILHPCTIVDRKGDRVTIRMSLWSALSSMWLKLGGGTELMEVDACDIYGAVTPADVAREIELADTGNINGDSIKTIAPKQGSPKTERNANATL